MFTRLLFWRKASGCDSGRSPVVKAVSRRVGRLGRVDIVGRLMAVAGVVGLLVSGLVTPAVSAPGGVGAATWSEETHVPVVSWWWYDNYSTVSAGQKFYGYCAMRDDLPGPKGGAYHAPVPASTWQGRYLAKGNVWKNFTGTPSMAKRIAFLLSKYGRSSDPTTVSITKIAMYRIEGVWDDHMAETVTYRPAADTAAKWAKEANDFGEVPLKVAEPNMAGVPVKDGVVGRVDNLGVTAGSSWYPGAKMKVTITSSNAVFPETNGKVREFVSGAQPAAVAIKRKGGGEITVNVEAFDLPDNQLWYVQPVSGRAQPLFFANPTKSASQGSKPSIPDKKITEKSTEVEFTTTRNTEIVSVGSPLVDAVTSRVKGPNGWPTWEEELTGDDGKKKTVTHKTVLKAEVSLWGPYAAPIRQQPGGPPAGANLVSRFTLEFDGAGQVKNTPSVAAPKAGFYTWTVEMRKAWHPAHTVKNLDTEVFQSDFGEAQESHVVKFRPQAYSHVQWYLTNRNDPRITGNDRHVTNSNQVEDIPLPDYYDYSTDTVIRHWGEVDLSGRRQHKDPAYTHEDLLVDSIDAYSANGLWLKDESGEYVPVTFTGKLYYVGTRPLPKGSSMAGMELQATRQITAYGPGRYTLSMDQAVRVRHLGFYTWVWEVGPQSGPHSEWIESGWQDQPMQCEETTSNRFEPQVSSEIKERNVNRNGAAIDRITIDGLPSDHPEFKGLNPCWGADNPWMHVTLYGPYDNPVGDDLRWRLTTDPSKNSEPKVNSVKIPARNGVVGERVLAGGREVEGVGWADETAGMEGAKGFLDRQFRPQDPGYYVFVVSFEGDHRVAPFISRTDDIYEWVMVDRVEPTVVTRADHRAEVGKPFRDTAIVTGQPPSYWKGAGFVFEAYGPFEPGDTPVATEKYLFKRVPSREKYNGVGTYPSREVVAASPGYYYWKAKLVKPQDDPSACAGLGFDPEPDSANPPVAPEKAEPPKIEVGVFHTGFGCPRVGEMLEVKVKHSGAIPEGSVFQVSIPDSGQIMRVKVDKERNIQTVGAKIPAPGVGSHQIHSTLYGPDSKVLATHSASFDTVRGSINVVNGADIVASLTTEDGFAPVKGSKVKGQATVRYEATLAGITPGTVPGANRGGTKPGVGAGGSTTGSGASGAASGETAERSAQLLKPKPESVTLGKDKDKNSAGDTVSGSKPVVRAGRVDESGNSGVSGKVERGVTQARVTAGGVRAVKKPPKIEVVFKLRHNISGKEIKSEPVLVTGASPAHVEGPEWSLDEVGGYELSAEVLVDGKPVNYAESCSAMVTFVSEPVKDLDTGSKPKPDAQPPAPAKGVCNVLWEGEIGDAGENTWVYPPGHPGLRVHTKAQAPNGRHIGDPIHDLLIVDGEIPEGAYATVDLFYNQSGEAKTCSKPVWTSAKVMLNRGAGEYATGSFTTKKEGLYHFRESVFDRHGKLIAQGKCGEDSETVKVEKPGTPPPPSTPPTPGTPPGTPPPPPSTPPTPGTPPSTPPAPKLKVRTEAQALEGKLVGKPIHDLLIVEGTVPEGAYATVDLFYNQSGEMKTCGKPIWTSSNILLTRSPWRYATNPYVTTMDGQYHFRESVFDRHGKLIAQGKCGEDSETVKVEKPRRVWTVAQAPKGKHVGDPIHDLVYLEGAFPKDSYVVVKLFYNQAGEAKTCQVPVWTSEKLKVPPFTPATLKTGEFKTRISGQYHFQETVYDGEGKILAQGDCGADSETLVITPDDSSSGGAGRDGGLAKTGVSPWVGRVSMLFLAAGLVLMVLSRRQHHHLVG
ncbi:hypothetical protein F4555_000576 [Mobiluncus mulieris]|uniref:Uncharacterized protein n=1 Tax=Mobiluncus mulieris TaxID=2052 RepID=A0A8G2M4Q9_9ACTO|nr:hypothetical protein [Mobiluncus mulieris]MBB5845780.1 hypothetical protein [Mobiluncus mulieris]STO15560.1 Uncharacterised protein [Mobiluncus mulieris]